MLFNKLETKIIISNFLKILVPYTKCIYNGIIKIFMWNLTRLNFAIIWSHKVKMSNARNSIWGSLLLRIRMCRTLISRKRKIFATECAYIIISGKNIQTRICAIKIMFYNVYYRMRFGNARACAWIALSHAYYRQIGLTSNLLCCTVGRIVFHEPCLISIICVLSKLDFEYEVWLKKS